MATMTNLYIGAALLCAMLGFSPDFLCPTCDNADPNCPSVTAGSGYPRFDIGDVVTREGPNPLTGCVRSAQVIGDSWYYDLAPSTSAAQLWVPEGLLTEGGK